MSDNEFVGGDEATESLREDLLDMDVTVSNIASTFK